jgi:ATP-dependent protease ClpP protease subunit
MTGIYIDGVIGLDVYASDIRKQLDVAGKSANVVISSPGGVVTEGFAIYNALRDYKRKGGSVTVTISGLCASMATYISTIADEGAVLVEDNAVFMIHNAQTIAMGDHHEMGRVAHVLGSLSNVIARAYINRTGKDAAEIAAAMDAETWLFGSEIVEKGFADGVIPAGEGAENRSEAMAIASAQFSGMLDKIKNAEREDIEQIAAMLPQTNRAPAAQQPKEKPKMADINKAAAPDEKQPDNVTEITAKAKADAFAAIKARNGTIKARFDAFCAANSGRVDDIRACYEAAIADTDQTVEQFTDAVLAKLAVDAEPVAGAHSTRVEGMMDEREKFRAGVGKWLAHRMGLDRENDRGNQFRGMRLHDIAAHAIKITGARIDGMTASELASKVMAAHTTSDFPYLLADSARKSLQAAYEAFPSTWQMIAANGSVSDFKTISLIKMGTFASLADKPEGAEYVAGTMSEEREQMAAATKGRFIELTREMIINDDLDGFSRMSSMLGRAAARTVNSDVYSVINTNGNLANGRAIFNTTDGNLAASGAAISVATLSAGRAAMRKQKDPSGNDYLNIMPRTLLVPVVKEDLAREVVNSTENTDTTGDRKRNPIRDWGPLEVVSDPYLDASSATAWYLIADPMDVPFLEVRFLDGNQTPYIDDTEEFLTDAIRWKVRLDYGVAANDRRGAYKNAGG